jgi:putative transposase
MSLDHSDLSRGITQRRRCWVTILNPGRGSRHATHACPRAMSAYRFRQSLSRNGDCWDKAVDDRFATIEHELVATADFGTCHAAQRTSFELIEAWYTRKPPHASLGSVSPVRYQKQRLAT